MENIINTRLILSVYEKVVTQGEAVEGEIEGMHQLEGVTAFSDFDGYTVYLEDAEVKLRTGFHNTYKLDYDTTRAFNNFVSKMKYIDANYA
ncbi:MAG TPA: DUF3081 family protein [Aliidiomarina sp.]|nr:DUF3081 family protein [Aliidiomarina sp.]